MALPLHANIWANLKHEPYVSIKKPSGLVLQKGTILQEKRDLLITVKEYFILVSCLKSITSNLDNFTTWFCLIRLIYGPENYHNTRKAQWKGEYVLPCRRVRWPGFYGRRHSPHYYPHPEWSQPTSVVERLKSRKHTSDKWKGMLCEKCITRQSIPLIPENSP